MHSTGLAHCWTKSKRRSTAIHGLVQSPELLYGKELEEVFDNAKLDCNLMIGHTRHATAGALTIANAHPFVFHSIIGAHNGTIPCLRNDDKKTNPTENSDSYYLFKSIEEKGLEETIKSLSEWTSAYALVIYDKKINHIRFLRNKERPLFFVCTNSGALYWSSTHLNLEYVLKSTNTWGNITKEGISSLPCDEVLTYDFNTNKWLQSYALAPEKKVYTFGGRSNDSFDYLGPNQDWKKDGWWSSQPKEKETPPSVPVVLDSSTFSDEEYVYRGYRGNTMSISRACELLAKGDAYWNMPRNLSDAVQWFSETDFIMFKDKDDLFVKQYLLMSGSSTYTGSIVRKAKKASSAIVAVG